eukprot:m.638138 g.638138  ORF g.638138 m.638138 type:complete len:358 (-) comp22604_c3_seq3:466-1539(-)
MGVPVRSLTERRFGRITTFGPQDSGNACLRSNSLPSRTKRTQRCIELCASQAIYDEDPVDTLIELPQGCTFEDWKNTGICLMQTDLLGRYLMMNISLRIVFANCPDEGLPYISVECVGSDCKAVFEFYDLKECSSDADCPNAPTLRCRPLNQYNLFDDNKGMAGQILWEQEQGDPCSNDDTVWELLIDALRALKNRATGSPYPSAVCETVLTLNNSKVNESVFDDLIVEDEANGKIALPFLQPVPVSQRSGCTEGFNGAIQATIPGASSRSDTGSSKTAIIVAVVVTLLVLIIGVAGALYYFKYRKSRFGRDSKQHPTIENPNAVLFANACLPGTCVLIERTSRQSTPKEECNNTFL